MREANLVVNVAKKLISGGLEPRHLTILTLYEAQKSIIKERLKDNHQVCFMDVLNFQLIYLGTNHVARLGWTLFREQKTF